MKILFVRHADPDYSIDSLTPQGELEAKALSERMNNTDVTYAYVSPLGRARRTAEVALSGKNITPVVLPWLREFEGKVIRPDAQKEIICWDWLPQDWTKEEIFYDVKHWADHPVMRQGSVREEYDAVIRGFDELLSKHGYTREGNAYRVERPNDDTIVLFCHLGVASVLMSHLMHISPMPLWHNVCLLTSSVSTAISEERREGVAQFRLCGISDVSHLYKAGLEPSFAARFCERFTDTEDRHD